MEIKRLKIFIIVLLSFFIFELNADLSLERLEKYLDMHKDIFYEKKELFKTIVKRNGNEFEYSYWTYKKRNGTWEKTIMSRQQKKDLFAALGKAHQNILQCLPTLPENLQKAFERKKSMFKFRFIFNGIMDFAKVRDEYKYIDGQYHKEVELNYSFLKNYNPENENPYFMHDRDGNIVPLHATLGHELMHFWFEKASGYPKYECEVHCLEKKCLDPNHVIPQISIETSEGTDQRECKGGWCQDEFCEDMENFECDPRKKKSVTGSMGSGYGRIDTSDDNFSYSSGTYISNSCISDFSKNTLNIDKVLFNYNYYPDLLIYNKFDYPDLKKLIDLYKGFSFIDDYVHDDFLTNHKILIIPSGEFMGDRGSLIIKEALKRYVESGNTILVLSQQYGSHFDKLMPVPVGEFLRSYGWREDQSCLHGSLYTKTVHPILSSLTKEQVSGAVDGYFDIYPSNSTKLLIRTKNNEPALIMYPYGENGGHVILTTLYTDWGYGHSQATTEELKLVRDLVTFARNPNLPIPMYNVSQNPTPQIILIVKVKNDSELNASKVKIKVYTPDRNAVLYEFEQSVSLTSGAERLITNMSGNML